jgi:hypothetical protein
MSRHRGRIDWPLLGWSALIVLLVVLVAVGVLAIIGGLLALVLS